jgi:S-adenosylmethionine decarboxylase
MQNEDKYLQNLLFFCADGAAYCLGSVNRDCWYLYTLHPLHGPRRVGPAEPDQTLEILMSELDPAVMRIFTREECSTAAEATRRSGIDKLMPDMVLDDFLFEPCGYSMNGIQQEGVSVACVELRRPGYYFI